MAIKFQTGQNVYSSYQRPVLYNQGGFPFYQLEGMLAPVVYNTTPTPPSPAPSSYDYYTYTSGRLMKRYPSNQSGSTWLANFFVNFDGTATTPGNPTYILSSEFTYREPGTTFDTSGNITGNQTKPGVYFVPLLQGVMFYDRYIIDGIANDSATITAFQTLIASNCVLLNEVEMDGVATNLYVVKTSFL